MLLNDIDKPLISPPLQNDGQNTNTANWKGVLGNYTKMEKIIRKLCSTLSEHVKTQEIILHKVEKLSSCKAQIT